MACPLFYSILVLTLFLSHDMIVLIYAGVAELADALDLGSSVPDVQVQVLSPAPKYPLNQVGFRGFLFLNNTLYNTLILIFVRMSALPILPSNPYLRSHRGNRPQMYPYPRCVLQAA